MNLKSYLPATGITLVAHLMQWFEQNPANGHSLNTGIRYDSASRGTINKQIRLAQASGVDAFMVDWYGSQDIHGDLAFKELLLQAEIMGFKAGICIDKGVIKGALSPTALSPTSAFVSELAYVFSTYAPSPGFFSDFIMEFGCGKAGVNFADVAVESELILHDDPKYGPFYTWVGLPLGQEQITPLYQNKSCVMGSVVYGFNDEAPMNCTQSVWGGPSRVMNRARLAGNWFAGWQEVPSVMQYVQLVTWNDYEEGTAIEGMLSAMNGIQVY